MRQVLAETAAILPAGTSVGNIMPALSNLGIEGHDRAHGHHAQRQFQPGAGISIKSSLPTLPVSLKAAGAATLDEQIDAEKKLARLGDPDGKQIQEAIWLVRFRSGGRELEGEA